MPESVVHYQHPGCEHCKHEVTNIQVFTVEFVIKYPRHLQPLTQLQIVNELHDALPKEWWWGSNMADWGLHQIR
jgi:hypothetical protein